MISVDPGIRKFSEKFLNCLDSFISFTESSISKPCKYPFTYSVVINDFHRKYQMWMLHNLNGKIRSFTLFRINTRFIGMFQYQVENPNCSPSKKKDCKSYETSSCLSRTSDYVSDQHESIQSLTPFEEKSCIREKYTQNTQHLHSVEESTSEKCSNFSVSFIL